MKKILWFCIPAFFFNLIKTNAQVYFNPPNKAYSAGTAPSSVITTDFNGDGKKDLATANTSSNNVSVLLGTGTGSFGTAVNYSVGTGPFVVTSADFNGDGKKDLATANGSSNNVSVLLGNGMGGFGAAANFAAGTGPRSITSGDFNGDTKIDLVTANYGSANVSVLLGNGTGGFGAPVNFAAGTGPRSVISAFLNADAIPDLVVSNEGSSNISVLIGTGTGSFGGATNFGTGTNPRSVTSADFNGDAKTDVATANGSNNVSVLMGTGTGSFSSAANYATGITSWSITNADFNTDGNTDLAVANIGSGNVSVLLGTGTGSFGTANNFASTIWTLPPGPASLISGDFNGDSKPDLAIANNNSAYNSLSMLLSYVPTVGSCPAPMRIVLLGASTTFGFGATEFDSAYAYRFRQFIIDSVNGYSEIINLAHAGYTTYAIQPTGYPAPGAYPVDTERNITKAISLNPDGVIFNFTTNDVNALINLDTTKNNFLRATNMLDALGIPFWVTTTQPRNFTGDPPATIAQKKQMLLDLRDTLIMLYPQNYIESYNGFADVNGDLLPQYDSGDHTHFNNAGHRLLFERVKAKGIHSSLCCDVLTCSNSSATAITNISGTGCANGIIKINFSGSFNFYPHLELYDVNNILITAADELPAATSHNFNNLISGKYTVKVFDKSCCEQDFVVQVKCPKPSGGFSTTNITSVSAKVNWNATSCNNGYRIQYRKQGTAIWTTKSNTANNKQLTGLVSSTTYEWRVATKCINSNPLIVSAYSAIQVFTTSAAREENHLQQAFEIVREINLNLHPNPSANSITVSFESDDAVSTMQIINVVGEIVLQKKLSSEEGVYEQQINISELPNGIYILKIFADNGFAIRKFVKH